MHSFTTLNIGNLFIRYRFIDSYPGDPRPRAEVARNPGEKVGFLAPEPPQRLGKGRLVRSHDLLEPERLDLAVRALRGASGQLPDVLCLQEVESMAALRMFNEDHCGGFFEHAYLIDSRDQRGLDVGVLTRWKIVDVRPHLDDRDDQGLIFMRECLEITLRLPGEAQETLTLYVNHFKSRHKEGETREEELAKLREGNAVRRRQAQRVADLVAERFGRVDSPPGALYAVVGDLNDTPRSSSLAPLLGSGLLQDAIGTFVAPEGDRWTYYWERTRTVQQLDHVLVSPALASRIKRVEIERRGVGYRSQSVNRRTLGAVRPKVVKLVALEEDQLAEPPAEMPADPVVDFHFERFERCGGIARARCRITARCGCGSSSGWPADRDSLAREAGATVWNGTILSPQAREDTRGVGGRPREHCPPDTAERQPARAAADLRGLREPCGPLGRRATVSHFFYARS